MLVLTGRASNWQDFSMNHIPDDGGSVVIGVYTVTGDKHLTGLFIYSPGM